MDSAERLKSEMGFEENRQISYSLREKPKKSWKSSSFDRVSASSMQENQCKMCDKKFKSPKALFGHMRHHSGRGKTRIPCKECGKTFESSKSLANHVRFHSDKSRVLAVKKKRSSRKRYNFHASLNESLSITAIDQEVDQAARCLMMLSQGMLNSPDNDSERVIGNECFKMNKPREGKSDSSASKFLTVLYEKQNILLGGEFEMHKVEDFIDKATPSETKFLPILVESNEDLMEEYGLIKKVNFDTCDAAFGGYFSNNVISRASDCEFKCETCKRMFGSRRALAGHRRMHAIKTQNSEIQKCTSISPECEAGCKIVRLKCLKDSMKQVKGGTVVEGHRSKKHKCPICLKEFATVQALGGHKRVHMVKNSKTRPQKTAIKQEHSEFCDELDLNIPIILDEEDIYTGDARSKPPEEPVVSLLAN